MPVITEKTLRKMEKEGILDKIHITEKDILTPSAKEFLDARKISYRKEKSEKRIQEIEKIGTGYTKNVIPQEGKSQQRTYKYYIT